MSTDLKLFKAQIFKISQYGRFLGSLLSKLDGPLMKVAIPLAKNVLAPLGITTASSAIDAGIQKKKKKKYMVLWKYNFLIISIEEINYVMKIIQTLEDSILLKGITKTKRRIFKYVIRYFRS